MQILIGADYYWSLVDGTIIKGGSSEPVVLSTKFGYVQLNEAALVLIGTFYLLDIGCAKSYELGLTVLQYSVVQM